MMTQTQCNELRDILISKRWGYRAYTEKMFRFLAVMPGGADGSEATVHYAYDPIAWKRAQCTIPHDQLVMLLIQRTPFCDRNLSVQYHDYWCQEWPINWSLTAKDEANNHPVLLLRERTDGSVIGALMRDPRIEFLAYHLPEKFIERIEVQRLVGMIRSLPADDRFMGLYKEAELEASCLEEAIAITPETRAGRKDILIYREDDWWEGYWVNPDKERTDKPLVLRSVADFYGEPVSTQKRLSRAGLKTARASQTLAGDYQLLDELVRQYDAGEPDEGQSYEEHPALTLLCNWWNANAPEAMREAGSFRLYLWQEETKYFEPGNPKEPALLADSLARQPCYALFEAPGRPVVAAVFLRGKRSNSEQDGYTRTYYANGDEFGRYGPKDETANETFYAMKGVELLRAEWAAQAERNGAHGIESDEDEATCIGCGCDDLHACHDPKEGGLCTWIRLDSESKLGVCSACPDDVPRWDNGDRQIRVSKH